MSKKKKGKKGRKEAFDPEKDTGILRPVDMTIAAGEINDRYSDYPSRGLNPVKLASILRDPVLCGRVEQTDQRDGYNLSAPQPFL